MANHRGSHRQVIRTLGTGVIATAIVTGCIHACNIIRLPVNWAVYPGMAVLTASGLFLVGLALLVIAQSTNIKE